VTDWLEVRLQLKSPEQGGRKTPVLPRGGYYKPHFRVSAGSEALGVAFTDGPPEGRCWCGRHRDRGVDL